MSREPWGAMEEEDEEEEEEDDDDEADGAPLDDASMTDDDIHAGISSVSSTAPSGLATPDAVMLRKQVNDGIGTPSALSTATVRTARAPSGRTAHGHTHRTCLLYTSPSPRDS